MRRKNGERKPVPSEARTAVTSVPCFNCGDLTTTRGPRSERRYCMKRACQAAKQRWNYASRNGLGARIEDRPCSNCGDAMQARPARVTDVEYGRWCRRSECQHARSVAGKELVVVTARWNALEGVTCEACGRFNAKKGYAHLRFGGPGMCYTTGEQTLEPGYMGLMIYVAKRAWKAQEELVAAVDEIA